MPMPSHPMLYALMAIILVGALLWADHSVRLLLAFRSIQALQKSVLKSCLAAVDDPQESPEGRSHVYPLFRMALNDIILLDIAITPMSTGLVSAPQPVLPRSFESPDNPRRVADIARAIAWMSMAYHPKHGREVQALLAQLPTGALLPLDPPAHLRPFHHAVLSQTCAVASALQKASRTEYVLAA